MIIKLKPSHLWSIALLIFVAISWFAFKFYNEQKVKNEAAEISTKKAEVKPALTVSVVKPSLKMFSKNISANGSVAPWQEAIIGAEVNGLMLSQVNVNTGDYVKKGQVLAQFSSSTIQADIAQSQASLAEAKASAIEAASNASRARSIQDTGALSTQQIEQYTTLEATSKARVAAAAATLQSQQIRLKQTKVISPDDGVISGRVATVGAVVSAGQELFKLIRQGKLEWRAELVSSEIGKINNGMPVNISLPDGSTLLGKVRNISPMVDTQTRNAIVFVELPPNSPAKAGMFARGSFDVGQLEVITLPASAVIMKDGFAYVMQVATDNRVKQIKVQVGKHVEQTVEILDFENTQNSNFVASGGAFLADGDTVLIAGQKPLIAKPISKPAP